MPMERNDAYPKLFAPIELAGKRLKNRIVHAAITMHSGAEQGMSARHLQYFANRARGGAAALVTEPLGIAPHQPRRRVRAWNASMEDDLKRWAEVVESADCRLLGQIQDAGRGRHAPGRNESAIGASALPDDLSWTVPHAMSAAEIRSFIDASAQSSLRLKRCGFSGVEISAGHGHLFHQFLSPRSNRRDDEYGGDLEGRTRFLVELSIAIRAVCGGDFILGVKLPGDDGISDSITPPLAAQIARHLVACVAVDYLCFAQGTHSRTLEMHTPNDSYPRPAYLPLIRELRKATPGVPVMALGRITDPAESEGILARGDADLIGLGRALITDAAWPLKAQAGRARDIRYCVSGNTCWKVVVNEQFVACDNNPRVSEPDEVGYIPAQAPATKRIVVVGAGIAGLEAAWTAAARGHAVTVIGSSTEVGGKTRLHASLPNSESLSSIYDYQYVAAQKFGVRFELGVTATAADILAYQPDAVVLATGSTMTWPLCLPDALSGEGIISDLREAMRTVMGRRERQRGTAVIFDMDQMEGTYAAAERLHELFAAVVLITPRERIAEDTGLVTRQSILRRLQEKGIRYECLAEPHWSEAFEQEGRLELIGTYGGTRQAIEDVAFFAYSTPRVPNTSLAAPLLAAGIAVHRIGDCKVARTVLNATAEGHAIGTTL